MRCSVLTIEYDCCGAAYTTRVALRGDQTPLGASGLGDTLIAQADATPDAEHPECQQPITRRQKGS